MTQIAEAVELIAPLALAEGWDNCGLQVGDPKEEVNRVLVALTPLPEVFEEAEKRGADFLLFHHPLIFDPLKAIVTSSYPGGLLARAIRNGHAVYAAHTSYDAAPAGVSVALARALGLGGPLRVLSPSFVEGFLTARVSQVDSMNRSSSCLVGRARMAP